LRASRRCRRRARAAGRLMLLGDLRLPSPRAQASGASAGPSPLEPHAPGTGTFESFRLRPARDREGASRSCLLGGFRPSSPLARGASPQGRAPGTPRTRYRSAGSLGVDMTITPLEGANSHPRLPPGSPRCRECEFAVQRTTANSHSYDASREPGSLSRQARLISHTRPKPQRDHAHPHRDHGIGVAITTPMS
jgi:hypothetical protein